MTELSVAMAATAAVGSPLELEAAGAVEESEPEGPVVSAGPAVKVVDAAKVGAVSRPLSVPVDAVAGAVWTGDEPDDVA